MMLKSSSATSSSVLFSNKYSKSVLLALEVPALFSEVVSVVCDSGSVASDV